MARAWRLSLQAEESLVEIARWTRQNFGPRQAEAYRDDLLRLCDDIAEGTAYARSCREHIALDVDPELMFARLGSHLVIFINVGDEIVIVDFLHARRDLPRLLLELDDDGT